MTHEYFQKTGLPESLIKTFVEDCDRLKAYHVDICTPSHPSHSDMLQRVNEEDRHDYTPFIDENKWEAFLEERKGFAMETMSKGFDWK